jgi:hypothetical protein
MTISDPSNIRRYAGPGNGFAYDKPVFSQDGSDLRVTLEDPNGVLSTPALDGNDTYDYAVTGAYDPAAFRYPNGVTVTLNTALPSGWTVAVENQPLPIQPSDYIEGGPLPAERLETDLDRLTVLTQIPLNAAGRTVLAPPTDPAGNLVLPPVAQRAGRLFGFDSSGDPVAQDFVTLGGVALSNSTPTSTGTANPGTAEAVSRADHVHNIAGGVGTAIGNLVQLIDAGGNAALPAVSGENLTGLPPYNVYFSDGEIDLDIGETKYIGLGQSSASDVMLVVIPQGGVVYDLRVVTTGSPGSGQNYVFTVHKNQAATTVTCTISGGNTTGLDEVNSFSVAAGDVLSLKAVASASADNTGGVFAAVVVAVQ